MNKILKNILLTIIIIIANVWSFIVINLANYGLYHAISTFPEKCSIDLPKFCIGTPRYNQLQDLGLVLISFELLIIAASIIYI